jgi:hypothetical protein
MTIQPRLLLACLLSSISLHAAGNDPFDKKNAPPPTPSEPVAEGLPGNILIVLETYHAPTRLVDMLMSEHLSAADLRDRLLRAIRDQADEVSLFDLQAITSKSGQRCRLESSDEASPAAKPAGVEWLAEPVLNSDGIGIDLSISHKRSQLKDFILAPGSAFGVSPQYSNRDVTLQLPTASEKVSLAAVNALLPAVTDAAPRAEVCFLIPQVCPLAQASTAIVTPWHLAARVYLVDRLLARDLVSAHGADSDQLQQKLAELAVEGKATLEMMQAGAAQSGQRGLIESGEDAAAPTSDGTKGATAAKKHALGWRIEFEPIVSQDGRTVNINVAFAKKNYVGQMTAHEQTAGPLKLSVFANRKITSTGDVRAGRQLFLGTLNEPSDTGINARKTSMRTALVFLEARVLP